MVKTIAYERARKQRLKEGTRVLGERVKLEKAELSTRKFEQKEKKAKSFKKFEKVLTKKLVSRKVLKPSQMTMIIQKREQEPYKPIYMKEFIEQEKRSMFFS